MNAHDRLLPDWFNRIKTGQISLPRFQRDEVWSYNEVSELITTVLKGLPAGATLILDVGNEEKFKSRMIKGAPNCEHKITEQLLDGQQRLTALWKSLNDIYDDRTYLIGFEDAENDSYEIPFVFGQARWIKNDLRYPLWVDDPKQCWERSVVPLKLLRPSDEKISKEIDEWIESAIGENVDDRHKEYKKIFNIITDLRTRILVFNLPYLSLPATTPKEVALDVFIKMNTSSVRLSTYDIVVALVEEETGKSLHEHVIKLDGTVPRAKDYADLPGLVLDVVALRQNRTPSQAGYKGIDYNQMLEDWNIITKSIKGVTTFLEDEKVFDAQRLPTYIPIPVITALWEYLPSQPDQLGNARTLLKKYLWRSFLTSRYEQSSASNALQDYRGLRSILLENKEGDVPIFNVESYPLPTKEIILKARWPKNKTILGRGILALQLNCGAEDIADGRLATISSITSKDEPREYHHLFPASVLEDAGITEEDIYSALNCALISWKTNRAISCKDPITYLKERINNCTLGESELYRRLKTHLIPYEKLAVGYDNMSIEDIRERTRQDYYDFLSSRAEIISQATELISNGQKIEIEKIIF